MRVEGLRSLRAKVRLRLRRLRRLDGRRKTIAFCAVVLHISASECETGFLWYRSLSVELSIFFSTPSSHLPLTPPPHTPLQQKGNKQTPSTMFLFAVTAAPLSFEHKHPYEHLLNRTRKSSHDVRRMNDDYPFLAECGDISLTGGSWVYGQVDESCTEVCENTGMSCKHSYPTNAAGYDCFLSLLYQLNGNDLTNVPCDEQDDAGLSFAPAYADLSLLDINGDSWCLHHTQESVEEYNCDAKDELARRICPCTDPTFDTPIVD